MCERIRGTVCSYDDALYKSMHTLLYFNLLFIVVFFERTSTSVLLVVVPKCTLLEYSRLAWVCQRRKFRDKWKRFLRAGCPFCRPTDTSKHWL